MFTVVWLGFYSYRPKNKYHQDAEKDGSYLVHSGSHKRVATVISEHSALSQYGSVGRNCRLSWPQLNTTLRNDDHNSSKESKTSLSGSKENDSNWVPSTKCLCPVEAEVLNRANQIVMYVLIIILIEVLGSIAGY